MRKHIKYFSYVARHRWFVFVACCKLGIPWQGLVHDLSKFTVAQWFAYVNWFHTDQGARQAKLTRPIDGWEHRWHQRFKDAFFKSVLLHYNRSPHHWQFWIAKKDPDTDVVHKMPERYVKEMVADWWAVGAAFGTYDLAVWYTNNAPKMVLDPDTRELVEKLVPMVIKMLPKPGNSTSRQT